MKYGIYLLVPCFVGHSVSADAAVAYLGISYRALSPTKDSYFLS